MTSVAPQPATTPVLSERLRLRSSPSPRQIGLKYSSLEFLSILNKCLPDVRVSLITKVYGGFQGQETDIVTNLTDRDSVIESWVRYPNPRYLRLESNRLRAILKIVFS